MNRQSAVVTIAGVFWPAVFLLAALVFLASGCSSVLKDAAVGTVDHYRQEIKEAVEDEVEERLGRAGRNLGAPETEREDMIWYFAAMLAGNAAVIADRRWFHNRSSSKG